MVKEDNEKTAFTCELCNFKTSNKKDYTRHTSTKKHIKMAELRENDNKNTLLPITAHECKCGKKYSFTSGLSRHKKKCTSETEKNASTLIFIPSRSSNARGNVAMPLINLPILGDLNVQLCNKLLLHLSESHNRVVELLKEKNMQLLTENNSE
jgi:hypothetical protein